MNQNPRKLGQAIDKYLEENARTAKGNSIAPVMEPLYNAREIAKQLVLLELHHGLMDVRCADCIRKHFITAEALAEEAVLLDREGKYPEFRLLAPILRQLQVDWENGRPQEEIQQEIRQLRKPLLKRGFAFRGTLLSLRQKKRRFLFRVFDLFSSPKTITV